MLQRVVVLCILFSIHCFGATAFFNKDTNIPPVSCNPQSLHFCTTRTLDDGSLKSILLRQLKERLQIEVFVETGTYLGDTTIKAAEIFNKVHTIELSPTLYLNAQQRLEPWKNIQVHLGESSEVLPYVLTMINQRTLFYLDGHYSGHVTSRGTLDTPILEELVAIADSSHNDSIILIDDIRLFQTSCFPEKVRSLHLGLEDYPDLSEVVKAILHIDPNYQICFLGDALLAFPGTLGVSITPVMHACALHRLEYICDDLTEDELERADQTISKAGSDEKEEVAVYSTTYSPFELDYGYRSFGCFWQALILLENGDEQQGRFLLKQAASKSLPGWSVDRWAE